MKCYAYWNGTCPRRSVWCPWHAQLRTELSTAPNCPKMETIPRRNSSPFAALKLCSNLLLFPPKNCSARRICWNYWRIPSAFRVRAKKVPRTVNVFPSMLFGGKITQLSENSVTKKHVFSRENIWPSWSRNIKNIHFSLCWTCNDVMTATIRHHKTPWDSRSDVLKKVFRWNGIGFYSFTMFYTKNTQKTSQRSIFPREAHSFWRMLLYHLKKNVVITSFELVSHRRRFQVTWSPKMRPTSSTGSWSWPRTTGGNGNAASMQVGWWPSWRLYGFCWHMFLSGFELGI